MGDDSKELTEILSDVRAHAVDGPRGRVVDVRFVEPDAETLADAERFVDRAGALLARSITTDSDGLAGYLCDLRDEIEAASDGAVVVTVELPDGARFGHLFAEPRAPDDALYRLCQSIGVDADPLDAAIVGSRVPVERRNGRWRIDVPAPDE